MKLRPMHTKSNYFRFLSLLILVLGASVGVVLATQKQVFDEPQAADKFTCELSDGCTINNLGSEVCGSNNWKYKCVYRYGRYFFTKSYNCESINKKCDVVTQDGPICTAECVNIVGGTGNCAIDGQTRCYGTEIQQCVDGLWTTYKNCNTWGQVCKEGKGDFVYCGTASKPKPTSTPTSAGWCQYDCSTRYECSTDGGTVVGGRCNTGEVCCKY